MDLLIRNEDSPKPGYSAISLLDFYLDDGTWIRISENSVSYWVSIDRLSVSSMVIMKDTGTGKYLETLIRQHIEQHNDDTSRAVIDEVELVAYRHMKLDQIRAAFTLACAKAHRKGRHEVQAQMRQALGIES